MIALLAFHGHVTYSHCVVTASFLLTRSVTCESHTLFAQLFGGFVCSSETSDLPSSHLLDMTDDRIHDKAHEDSDSESVESDVEETFTKIDVDPSKLTPLSPEVISKQVCTNLALWCSDISISHFPSRPPST